MLFLDTHHWAIGGALSSVLSTRCPEQVQRELSEIEGEIKRGGEEESERETD
jgi:hypothetical protein